MNTVMYFDEMNILQSDKDNRVKMADNLTRKINDEFNRYIEDISIKKDEMHKDKIALILVAWLTTFDYFDSVKYEENKETIDDYIIGFDSGMNPEIDAILDISEKELLNELKQDAYSIADTTIKHESEARFTSKKRAEAIARDFTNKYTAIIDLQIAIEAGMKLKTWRAMSDRFTRDSHREMDGTKIPINSVYEVNGYYMMYPMDSTYGAPASETAGCRCVLIFSKN